MAIPNSICDEHVSCGAEETRRLGERFGALLDAGDTVRLDGPLGAGKTQFVKGIADALGCAEEPSSPTFTLAHEYTGGRAPLLHFDFYRLEDAAELARLDLADCVGSDAVVVVEWAEKFPAALPEASWSVRLAPAGGDTRRIRILPPQ